MVKFICILLLCSCQAVNTQKKVDRARADFDRQPHRTPKEVTKEPIVDTVLGAMILWLVIYLVEEDEK